MNRPAPYGAAARRFLGSRLFWLLLLLATALWYFGGYVRYGINFRDEGGTFALVAKRLLAGERPFLDVQLGYNVLWFYPVVGLFKLTGVNFVLLRAYCFALSTAAAILSYLILVRAGKKPWLAYVIALLTVLVPGMTFKNYMPFLAVANSFCLAGFALAGHEELVPRTRRQGRRFWIVAGGLLLGATYLIRIDLGAFFSVLWVGALAGHAMLEGPRAWTGTALPGLAVLGALVVTEHLPVYLDAQRRGFAPQFVQQYIGWEQRLLHGVERKPVVNPAALPSPAATAAPAPARPVSTEILHRKTWADFQKARNNDARALILLLYAPFLSLVPLIGWAIARFIAGWRRGQPKDAHRALAALLLIGGALAVFPQYFFFRPDSPHLSEFSPAFWTAAFGATLLLGGTHSWASRALLLLLTAHAGLFLWRMFPDRWAGTNAVRKNRTVLFHGPNGTDVFLGHREVEGLQPLLRIVREHSTPVDYLVAYPYHPAINLLADRPTYEKNVYVDNATSGPGWSGKAIIRLEQFHPAVVVLSDWDINGTEASRFSVWATETKTWIQTHYHYQGTYLEFEVYTRD